MRIRPKITATVSKSTKDLLDKLADIRLESRAYVINKALETYLNLPKTQKELKKKNEK